MTRLALLAAAALASASAACLVDEDLALVISDAPGTIAEAETWSTSSGSVGLYPEGAVMFPRAHSLRAELVRAIDTSEQREAIALGTIEVVAGSSCRLTRAATCTGSACTAELELTGPGTCMVRVRSATPDGEERARCWYRTERALDPSDPDQLTRLTDSIEREAAACSDAL